MPWKETEERGAMGEREDLYPIGLTPPQAPSSLSKAGTWGPRELRGEAQPLGSLQMLLETNGVAGHGTGICPHRDWHPAPNHRRPHHCSFWRRCLQSTQELGQDWGWTRPFPCPTGHKPTATDLSSRGQEGPAQSKPCNDPAAMPGREPRSPGSQGRVTTRERVSRLVPATCPAAECQAVDQHVPARCSSRRQGEPLPSAPSRATPQPQGGLKGKPRQKGSGRAAQARTTPCSHLQWPLSPSARSKKMGAAWVWLSLTTWHCPTTIPSHPVANPCTSPPPGATNLPRTLPPPKPSQGQGPVPTGSQCQAGSMRMGTTEVDQIRSWRRA